MDKLGSGYVEGGVRLCYQIEKMDIFEALENMVAFIGLEAILKGKEVETSTGCALGVVRTVDVRRYRAWMVIDSNPSECGEILVDIDKIRTLGNKITISEDGIHLSSSNESPDKQCYLPVPHIT